jgi:predicted ATPase/DNA-binding XRE family transcriptional regulator
MPGMSAFAELLKRNRRAAGFSQETLADRSGLSIVAVAALEQGRRRGPYRETVTALGDALGLSPDERAELEAAAASGRGRSRQEPPLLPQPLTSFIERTEVAEISALLVEHRLLTVTGSGGVGKTRVAIEVARHLKDSFDQVCFVDLLPVRDASMLAPHVAARLNVSMSGGDALTAIVRHFATQHALIVLDNCEHLVGETGTIAAALLRECPNVTVLLTSREALEILAESLFRLPPMSAAAAADLFVVRARAQDRSLFFDTDRLAIVADICKELDRMPLAIELAASRLATLGFTELRRRLKSTAMLTAARDVPARHQTIVDTIRWSYDLLTDVDRLIFGRLSVFIGGFELATAEAVCVDASAPAGAIADSVLRLVQKSLLYPEHLGTSTRYRFLETIRAFGWERLSEQDAEARTMLRLIEWLTREAAVVETSAWPDAIAPLRNEIDNVAAAVSWAIGTTDAEAIAAAARALIVFRGVWYGTSRHGEFRRLGFWVLDHLRDDEHPELVGLLISALAPFLTGAELVVLATRAIPLLTAIGYRAKAAGLHARIARYECVRGEAATAEVQLAAGAALLTSEERLRTRAGFAFSTNCAYVRSILRDFTGARAALEGLVIPPGDPYEIDVPILLAEIEFRQRHFKRALDILTGLKPRLATYPSASLLTVMVFGNAAKCEVLLGNAAEAEADFRQAFAHIVDAPNIAHFDVYVDVCRYATVVAAECGRPELAARLLGACAAATDPSSLENVDHATELAAQTLGASLSPERAEALRARGAGEDLFDLVEEFLEN